MSKMEKILELGKKKYGLKVAFKDRSLFMRVLGKLLFFNPDFMTRYTTVIGSTVYFPSETHLRERGENAATTIAHELVHIADSKNDGAAIFAYSYLFPQVLAPLSLIALGGNLLWLLCLLFLLPLPAPFRAYYELRGYAITDAVHYKLTKQFTDIDWMAKQFTSSSYYFMFPLESFVKDAILENRRQIIEGQISKKIECADEILKCFD